jgi:hypothetical protein
VVFGSGGFGCAVLEFGESDAGDGDFIDFEASESAEDLWGLAANELDADVGVEHEADHKALRFSAFLG